MFELRRTPEFQGWLVSLADGRARTKVLSRMSNMSLGNVGPCKAVGGGVSESKIDYGPGYRVYFVSRATRVIVLLAGGDKSTQQRDIRRARALAAGLGAIHGAI